jgi:hypothetical protein
MSRHYTICRFESHYNILRHRYIPIEFFYLLVFTNEYRDEKLYR